MLAPAPAQSFSFVIGFLWPLAATVSVGKFWEVDVLLKEGTQEPMEFARVSRVKPCGVTVPMTGVLSKRVALQCVACEWVAPAVQDAAKEVWRITQTSVFDHLEGLRRPYYGEVRLGLIDRCDEAMVASKL